MSTSSLSAKLLLGMTSLAFAAASSAALVRVTGERAGHWDASLLINWVEGETLDYDGGGEIRVKDSWGWGFGIHYNIDNHWNVGFDMALNRPDYSAKIQTDRNNPNEFTYIDHTAYRYDGQFNGQYNILKGPVTPYLQAGLGWTYMDSNIVKDISYYCGGGGYYYPYCRAYANTFDETSFSWNVGLGVRWDIGDYVFMRVAVIQQWIDTSGDPEPLNGRFEVGAMF